MSNTCTSASSILCLQCKRLKLKCDRRSPCSSCTKRDTVARCIYSSAAAEKVDLHSLNNRLVQVEAALAQLTAGTFQSTYRPAQPQNNPPTLTSAANPTPSRSISLPTNGHLHHHHPAATTTHVHASPYLFALSLDELHSACLANWRLNCPTLGYRAQPVKLENSPVESERETKLRPATYLH